ncbi:MAG: hypothetical protein A3F09_00465 [Chlamydiae bacterium RIFCSPHIGHO2_12_FULL_49_11]|nr:MAG: hypothetical protein A3F09_00465 [Chlamydiae bacterium RIFCSPHIGHO2_12_FULL_49_11]
MNPDTKIILRDLFRNEERSFDFHMPFDDAIDVRAWGRAYLAENTLIIHLNIEYTGKAVCIICNEKFEFKSRRKEQYITEEVENIPSGVYNLENDIRDAVILETPRYQECCDGKCPDRTFVKKYLKP